MKILAFTDSHGSQKNLDAVKKKAAEADIILCCGDFTVFGSDQKVILKEINKLGKKVLLIHGNHDDEDEAKEECKKLDNVEFLHKKFYEHDGILFCGYGGGGFAQKDPEFEEFEETIAKKLNKNTHLVMLFHMPPYNTELDKLSMGHVGSKSYTSFIKKHKPLITFSGHIEENNGKKDSIGKTTVINPGPTGKIVKIEKA
jgi:uncharacterized protein